MGSMRNFIYALILVSVVAPARGASTKVISEADCTAQRVGGSIPVSKIGEPVSEVTVSAPQWNAATANSPAFCSV